jgi:L-2-hydroxyglutarate oxidase LhgO
MACDVLVIGGDIAGVSVGAELAGALDVLVVESEAQLAFHTTGRPAVTYHRPAGAGRAGHHRGQPGALRRAG